MWLPLPKLFCCISPWDGYFFKGLQQRPIIIFIAIIIIIFIITIFIIIIIIVIIIIIITIIIL